MCHLISRAVFTASCNGRSADIPQTASVRPHASLVRAYYDFQARVAGRASCECVRKVQGFKTVFALSSREIARDPCLITLPIVLISLDVTR